MNAMLKGCWFKLQSNHSHNKKHQFDLKQLAPIFANNAKKPPIIFGNSAKRYVSFYLLEVFISNLIFCSGDNPEGHYFSFEGDEAELKNLDESLPTIYKWNVTEIGKRIILSETIAPNRYDALSKLATFTPSGAIPNSALVGYGRMY